MLLQLPSLVVAPPSHWTDWLLDTFNWFNKNLDLLNTNRLLPQVVFHLVDKEVQLVEHEQIAAQVSGVDCFSQKPNPKHFTALFF